MRVAATVSGHPKDQTNRCVLLGAREQLHSLTTSVSKVLQYLTDRKIRIHAFYCMLGISLLQYVHKQAQTAWDGISMEQLLEQLQQIQQFAFALSTAG